MLAKIVLTKQIINTKNLISILILIRLNRVKYLFLLNFAIINFNDCKLEETATGENIDPTTLANNESGETTNNEQTDSGISNGRIKFLCFLFSFY